MRVNVYAEEMTQRVELVSKTIDGAEYVGVRFYLELPVTVPIKGESPLQAQGPFHHRGPYDDDSSAVTFWGKRDLRDVLKKAVLMLDHYYREAVVACEGRSEQRNPYNPKNPLDLG